MLNLRIDSGNHFNFFNLWLLQKQLVVLELGPVDDDDSENSVSHATRTKFAKGMWRFSPARRDKTIPREKTNKGVKVLWHSGLHRTGKYATDLSEVGYKLGRSNWSDVPCQKIYALKAGGQLNLCPE